jgi:hypothetical protein
LGPNKYFKLGKTDQSIYKYRLVVEFSFLTQNSEWFSKSRASSMTKNDFKEANC